ncbi:MAG: 3-phosphoshikimate 1-carboxyvinyltransferase [Alphaproteobacteria bacterium]|nr:3-phosphoshikimate 1-carboxyvinyltransferase [Alphaproteobacteria bacterium]
MTTQSPPLPLAARSSGPLKGRLRVPGDKSISHRALILGALAAGETTIAGLLEGEDVLNSAAVLRALGADIVRDPAGVWHVHGFGVGGFSEPTDILDHGNSGTGVRLMLGAVATTPIMATFTGDASLRKRPMRRVLDPIERFGAQAVTRDGGLLPITMKGAKNPVPITYRLPVPSAQVKSAILLAGLNAPGDTTVIEAEPTRDHTERMLTHFGAVVRREKIEGGLTAITLVGQPELRASHVQVPADPSSAAFPIVAALIVPGSEIRIDAVMLNPTRTGLITVLKRMGADITIENERSESGETVGDLVIKAGPLKGVDVEPEIAPSMIDEYPVLAIAAAFAEGRTKMMGLGELRVKESDRLAAVADGLIACGIKIELGSDWLAVEGLGVGGMPGGGKIATHMDHRIAMAFLIAGLAAKAPVTVDDTSFVATSFPDFIPLMQKLGAIFTRPNQ